MEIHRPRDSKKLYTFVGGMTMCGGDSVSIPVLGVDAMADNKSRGWRHCFPACSLEPAGRESGKEKQQDIPLPASPGLRGSRDCLCVQRGHGGLSLRVHSCPFFLDLLLFLCVL